MGDELLEHYREYGAPNRACSYTEQEDGSVRIQNMDGACCLNDFSDLDFYLPPKKDEKLKKYWRK